MYELIEQILEIACPLYTKEQQRERLQELLGRYTQDVLAERLQSDGDKPAVKVARGYRSAYDVAIDQGKTQIAFRCWSDPIYDDGEDGLELIGEEPWAVVSGKAAHMRQLFPENSIRYFSEELEYVECRPWALDEVRAFLAQKGYEVEL